MGCREISRYWRENTLLNQELGGGFKVKYGLVATGVVLLASMPIGIWWQGNQFMQKQKTAAANSLDLTMHRAQNGFGENTSPQRRFSDFLKEQTNSQTPAEKQAKSNLFIKLPNGEKIAYYYNTAREKSKTPKTPAKTLIYFHGKPGIDPDMSRFVKEINQTYNVLVISSYGYLPSSGEPTTPKILQYGYYAVSEILKRNNIDPTDTTILGHSMGAQLAAYTATKLPVGHVILYKPIVSLVRSCETTGIDRSICAFLTPNDLDVSQQKLLALFTTKVIGERDTIINPTQQLQILTKRTYIRPEDHFTVDIPLLRKLVTQNNNIK